MSWTGSAVVLKQNSAEKNTSCNLRKSSFSVLSEKEKKNISHRPRPNSVAHRLRGASLSTKSSGARGSARDPAPEGVYRALEFLCLSAFVISLSTNNNGWKVSCFQVVCPSVRSSVLAYLLITIASTYGTKRGVSSPLSPCLVESVEKKRSRWLQKRITVQCFTKEMRKPNLATSDVLVWQVGCAWESLHKSASLKIVECKINQLRIAERI